MSGWAVAPVLGLRFPFLGIDICGILLRHGIINGGSALNNSKAKSTGLFFRHIPLNLPSTSEQNLQLIEVFEVFWLHTPRLVNVPARKLQKPIARFRHCPNSF